MILVLKKCYKKRVYKKWLFQRIYKELRGPSYCLQKYDSWLFTKVLTNYSNRGFIFDFIERLCHFGSFTIAVLQSLFVLGTSFPLSGCIIWRRIVRLPGRVDKSMRN
jgi:hypothetical protein